MKIEKCSIGTCVILSFLTFGIYGIFWAAKLAKQAVQINDCNDDGTAEVLLTIFVPFIGYFMAEKKFNEGCVQRGIQHTDNSIMYLVLGLFGLSIVDACLMQSNLNTIADMEIDLNRPCPPFQQAQSTQNGSPAYTEQNVVSELKKYKELLDAGVITEEEFDIKKKKLLGLL